MKNNIYQFVVYGRPVPKARPRVTNNSTRTPQKTRDFETKVIAKFQQKFGRPNFDKKDEFKVNIKSHYTDHKTADIDNLIKAIMDSIGGNQKKGYKPFDDKQVKRIGAEKIVDSDGTQYTEIMIEKLDR